MNEPAPIADRLKLLIDAARSQKEVARVAQVSDGTLINWMRGLGLRESKVREVAENLGVSLRWLRDGVGDDEAELAAFRERLQPQFPGARGALHTARESAGLSLAELAKRTGYPTMILSQLESGTIHASEKLIDALCRELPTLSKEDMMGGSDHPHVIREDGMEATHGARVKLTLPLGMQGQYVPLLSYAQAGMWDSSHSDAMYDYTSIFALNVDDRRAFAIKVAGNSMEPALHEGDMVICSPAQQLHNGDAAVVRTRSENVYIKYWHKRGDRVLLESANPDYKPIEYPVGEIAGAWPIVQTITAGKVRRQES
ncbi:MAG TPA: XRE family transcriptional regulator [Chthoniobacter sp.]|nr:XRE family transcriptional regulator [Chthoniobacter sp.]